jgi:hypothetical protein
VLPGRSGQYETERNAHRFEADCRQVLHHETALPKDVMLSVRPCRLQF